MRDKIIQPNRFFSFSFSS